MLASKGCAFATSRREAELKRKPSVTRADPFPLFDLISLSLSLLLLRKQLAQECPSRRPLVTRRRVHSGSLHSFYPSSSFSQVSSSLSSIGGDFARIILRLKHQSISVTLLHPLKTPPVLLRHRNPTPFFFNILDPSSSLTPLQLSFDLSIDLNLVPLPRSPP